MVSPERWITAKFAKRRPRRTQSKPLNIRSCDGVLVLALAYFAEFTLRSLRLNAVSERCITAKFAKKRRRITQTKLTARRKACGTPTRSAGWLARTRGSRGMEY